MENGQPQMSKKERRMLRRQEKAENKISHEKKKVAQRIQKIIIQAVFLILIFGFMGWKFTRPKTGQTVADLGNDHIASVDTEHVAYNSIPPTSGPHLGSIAPWGVSDVPIPNELQIHNLEDGGVMVQYNCIPGKETQDDCGKLIKNLTNIVDNYTDKVVLAPYPDLDSQIAVIADYQKGCPELVSQLKEIVSRYNEQVLMSPYPELPSKIALTAWTRIDAFDEFDEKRIVNFIQAYRGIDHHVK